MSSAPQLDSILDSEPVLARARQLKLFHLENQLTLRFGNEFFRALPQSPGVYFFYDASGTLLYIGQSSDLRTRLGSYRHVSEDKHPRRTLRLVARVAKIELRECVTAEEAIAEEARLLLEHRPPFNRAGVWKGVPWWLSVQQREGALDLCLSRKEAPESIGPLPAGFRHTLPRLLRCLLRAEQPSLGLADFPCGLMRGALPLEFSLRVGNPACLREQLASACVDPLEELIAALSKFEPSASIAEQEFWQDELKHLQNWSAKQPLSNPPQSSRSVPGRLAGLP